MLAKYRQFAISVVDQATAQHTHIDLKIWPVQPALDSDFPYARYAEKQFVVLVNHQRASAYRHPLNAVSSPKQQMGIQW